MMKNYQVIVVGGGPSGMMAAITAAKQKKSVLLIERNDKLGKKLYLTGNGRCNYSNFDISESCYFSDDTKKAWDVISQLPPKDLQLFFQEIGLLTTLLHDTYLYPRSLQASSVVLALTEALKQYQVDIALSSFVREITPAGVVITESGEQYTGNHIIICCGGNAVPKSGSDGNGYRLAYKLGHKRVSILPGLVPLYTADSLSKLHGVRCFGKASLFVNHELQCAYSGEIQFVKEGVSGIPVFQCSHFANLALEQQLPVSLVIDLYEEAQLGELQEYLLSCYRQISDQKDAKEKTLYSLLCGIVPEKMAEYLISQMPFTEATNPPMAIKLATVSEDMICSLAVTMKKLSFEIVGSKDFKDAQVTCGGIPWDEINATTLASIYAPRIHFAGEIMDVDGICGGYNLQWAFASGYVAGLAASKDF